MFPEQTLGPETEVSQPPVQKYGTVCRLQRQRL